MWFNNSYVGGVYVQLNMVMMLISGTLMETLVPFPVPPDYHSTSGYETQGAILSKLAPS